MTYSEAIQYLQGTNRAFCKPGTERVSALCGLLGNPQSSLPVVHVTGTNGKGSFCVILASLLQSSGKRVGRFSSPYLCEINECVTVNGGMISDGEFARLVTEIQPLADGLEDRPTEFEILTALAFTYFRDRECDVVVIECGMGGQNDATNIIEAPLLSVITGVSVDHSAFLGDTVSEIARNKGGIVKEHCPVLWCGKDLEAEGVIRRLAAEKNAPFYSVPKESLQIRRSDLCGTVFDFDGRTELFLSLTGLYQAENAANAITAVKLLNLPLSEDRLRNGLRSVAIRGRFEVLSKSPLIIADGGHNPDGVARGVESIRTYFPAQKVVLVSGIMRDKEYETVARLLSSVAHTVYTVTPKNPRALSAEEYASVFESLGISATPCTSVEEGLCCALSHKLPVVCIGSLYQYREIAAACEDLGISPLDK